MENAPTTPAPAAPATPPPAVVKAPEAPKAPGTAPATPAPAPAATSTPAATEREKLDAARIAVMVKKEAENVRREQAVKTREATFAQHEADLKTYRELMDLKAKDPVAFLEKVGITYDELTKRRLEAPAGDDPGTQALKKLAELEKRAEAEKAQAAEAAQAAAKTRNQRAVETKRAEVGEYLKANADTFELTNQYAAGEDVLKEIVDHLRATTKFDEQGNVIEPGKVLSVKEAAELVENKLEAAVKKALGTKKFSALVKPAEPVKTPEKKPEPTATLSDDLGPSSTPEQAEDDLPLDIDERMAEILRRHKLKNG